VERLKGKVAVVTGAGSGIGHAIADLFAREGASIGVVDLDATKAKEVAAAFAGHGVKTVGVAADVGDEPAVKAAFGTIVATLGEVDILVNNAGIDTTSPVETMSTAMFDDMIRVHLKGTFLCTREVIPAMRRKGWGRIINLSSQLAHKGAQTMAHYCAAKAGIMGFTRSLAYELAHDGITVNSINPGPIETPLLLGLPRDWLDRKKAELPIGRFGRVDEVAPTALLLASEEGSYFVGASLNMNGGDVMV
jgi:3-oxoacyl-[acyl-carrier protein] reductase